MFVFFWKKKSFVFFFARNSETKKKQQAQTKPTAMKKYPVYFTHVLHMRFIYI